MGGYGSGRYYRGMTKETVENCHSFDANNLTRWGYLKQTGPKQGILRWMRGDHLMGACGFHVQLTGEYPSITFRYLYNNTEHPNVQVELTWYSPGFGGRRYLFLCPCCKRRMRTLHLKGGEIACRLCHQLTYESCVENHKYDSLFRYIAQRHNDFSWQTYKKSFNSKLKHVKRNA